MLSPRENPAVLDLDLPVSQFSAHFSEEEFSESTASTLNVRLPADFQRAVRKRKAEYVAGRFCALQAIRAVLPDFKGDIEKSPDRSPKWPVGIVGSITHTTGFASAAIASDKYVRSIGIDSEQIMSEETMWSVKRLVASAGDPFPVGMGLSVVGYYTLLFSAKESIFKCLHPLVRKMFSFEHARVEIVDPVRKTFSATLLIDLSDEFRVGTTLEGSYQLSDQYVHTGVMLVAREQHQSSSHREILVARAQ